MAILSVSFSSLDNIENNLDAASVRSPFLLRLGSLNSGPKPISYSPSLAFFTLILKGTEGE